MNMLIACLTLCSWAAPLNEAQILEGAQARIQQHRTGEMVLEVLGVDGKPLPVGTAVRIEQTRHAFLFGCNIFKLGRCNTAQDNAAYAKHFAELLNYATLPFYWWSYEKEKGKPDDARTEELVAWCKEQNIVTKGHPLAWNWQDPRWLPDDPRLAMQAQFDRIERCAERFKGDIDIWDVVNEATAYARPEPKKNAPIMTQAIRQMGVGPYVRQAFAVARKGNPDATLVINDYRTELDYTAKVLDELTDDEGRPLYDVIGIQSHQHGGPWPVRQIWEVCERFARYGKPLHFTETTFLSGQVGWDLKNRSDDPDFKWDSTPEGEQRQAEEVVRFYTVLFSHPAVEAITWWDFTDQNAWQRAPAGMLRADMTPKPAYNELLKLVKGQWWTRTQASTDDAGRVTFRGFFGDYRVTAGTATATCTLERKTQGPIRVELK